jgi:opacity protein-like surface antigen
VAAGLPLGVDFTRHGLTAGVTRKLTESLSANLRYGYYQYDEPTGGDANDYTAHGVFVTINYRWP